MSTIGSLETYPKLQNELKDVLAKNSGLAKNFFLGCLIQMAEESYEKGVKFDSEIYYITIGTLPSYLSDTFLKAYFEMQIFYWKVDLKYSKEKQRDNEYYYRMLENPYPPNKLDNLRLHVNGGGMMDGHKRAEIFRILFFSYYSYQNMNEIIKLNNTSVNRLHHDERRFFYDILLKNPKQFQFNFKFSLHFFNNADIKRIIFFNIREMDWESLTEAYEYVLGMESCEMKSYALDQLNKLMCKHKLC